MTQTVERFSPTVMVDGITYTPRGWEWILGFALGGCQWAIDKVEKPEFREMVVNELRKRRVERLLQDIEHKQKDIERINAEVDELRSLIPAQFTRKLDL